MTGETASNEGGEIRLGVLARQSRYVIGVSPRLTAIEKVHLMEQDVFPTQLLEGAGYALVLYSIGDFLDSTEFPEEAFVNFAQELSQGLGERALSEEVKYIHLTPK